MVRYLVTLPTMPKGYASTMRRRLVDTIARQEHSRGLTVTEFTGKAPRETLPDARTVRDVLGQVAVGACLVSYHNTTAGRDRFPWRVYGPPNVEGDREILDEFAQYREAVAFARKAQ